jgi:hypothetical protein
MIVVPEQFKTVEYVMAQDPELASVVPQRTAPLLEAAGRTADDVKFRFWYSLTEAASSAIVPSAPGYAETYWQDRNDESTIFFSSSVVRKTMESPSMAD